MNQESRVGSRRNHLVPRFYLSEFADHRHQILQCRLGSPPNIHQTSLTNAVVELDFYTYEEPDGSRTDRVEKLLSRIEGEAASSLRALLDEAEWPLSADRRLKIATWIAVQALRGRSVRRTFDELATAMVQLEIALGGRSGLQEHISRSGERAEGKEIEDLWRDLSDFGSWEVTAHVNQHLVQMIEMLPGITNLILSRPWSFIYFDRRSLMTCDEPVVKVSDDSIGFREPTGLATAPVLLMPLSRRVGLWMSDVRADMTAESWRDHDRRIGGTTRLASFFNEAIRNNARRVLLAHPEDQDLLSVDLPQPRTREISGFDANRWIRAE